MTPRKNPLVISYNLSLDIGNTRVKAGLFIGREFNRKIEFDIIEGRESFYAWVEGIAISNVICSSVNKEIDLRSVLAFNYVSWMDLDKDTLLHFKNSYTSPETLGKDRLAAIAGAKALFPDKNVLVFDAGTCLTADFMDHTGNYLGGSISPGLKMRFKALHTFTARLPLLDPQLEFELIGTDTRTSILTGAIMGMKLEIEGFINEYRQIYPELVVILTGGDHIFFDKNLKNDIFVAPNLVLQGLNEILYHNHAF